MAAVDFVDIFGPLTKLVEQAAAGVGLRGMMRDGSLLRPLDRDEFCEDMGAVHGADLAGAGVEESAIAYRDVVKLFVVDDGGDERRAHFSNDVALARFDDHLMICSVKAAIKRRRNGLLLSLATVRVEERLGCGLGGDIAMSHATHAIAHDGQSSRVGMN